MIGIKLKEQCNGCKHKKNYYGLCGMGQKNYMSKRGKELTCTEIQKSECNKAKPRIGGKYE